MSMMKLMLPPVVSSGQYQIMESSIAMMEHMVMTDNAMIGPQWHSLRTSWRFSNVTTMEKMFIFFFIPAGFNRKFYLCYLAHSAVRTTHIVFLVFCVKRNWPGVGSLLFSVSHCAHWQRAASSTAELHYSCQRLKFAIYGGKKNRTVNHCLVGKTNYRPVKLHLDLIPFLLRIFPET